MQECERRMKCEYCGRGKATAIIYDDNEYRFRYICDHCLNKLVSVFGEVNLEIEYLFNHGLLVDWLKRTANREIKYREDKLKKLRR